MSSDWIKILKSDAWYQIFIQEPLYFLITEMETEKLDECLRCIKLIRRLKLLRTRHSCATKEMIRLALIINFELKKLYRVKFGEHEVDYTEHELLKVLRSLHQSSSSPSPKKRRVK